MFEMKRITRAGVATALQKAERYRLLNEPSAAESICLDVLEVEPDNQAALVQLALARSDQFEDELSGAVERAREPLARVDDPYKRAYYHGIVCERRAREPLARVDDPYRRAYYHGIVCERRARAQLHLASPGGGAIAYDWLRRAMEFYEEAERLRPEGHDEALLRWNTCARIIERHQLRPAAREAFEPVLGE